MHTHYDNLQIDPNATDAEIKAAYRRLSSQYHPDRNPDPESKHIMQLINRAYEVLSDPKQRAQHDAWIASQNMQYGDDVFLEEVHSSSSQSFLWWGLGLVFLCLLGGYFYLHWDGNRATSSKDNTLYTIYETTPTGNAWPVHAAYLENYPHIVSQGKQQLTIHNQHEKSAIMAYVFAESYAANGALRTIFIPSHEKWTLKNMPDGRYWVTYMRLDTGDWYHSGQFSLPNHSSLTLQ